MSQNLQLQKTVNIHATRIRHRRRLLTTDGRFRSRHPGLANFLTREAARANATPQRITDPPAVAAGGTGWSVGDQFLINGGTFTVQAIGQVAAEAAGVVTAVSIVQAGRYTANPGVGATTTAILPATGIGLTVTTALTGAVVGVTDQELLTGLRGQLNIAGTVPIITRARHFRNPLQTDQTYLDNGVPIV